MSNLEGRATSVCLKNFLAEQFLKDEFSDVTFCVENERFPAHRVILASRKYFRPLLFGQFAEKQQSDITLLEVPAIPFKALLKYIYNDSILLDEMKPDEVIGLLKLAHMYNFEELTESIQVYLEQRLTLETVYSVLEVSQYLNLDSLFDVCLKFMDENAPALLLHDSIANLSKVK